MAVYRYFVVLVDAGVLLTICPLVSCVHRQPTTLLKVLHLHGCFSRFLNCTNGTKSHRASHIYLNKPAAETH